MCTQKAMPRKSGMMDLKDSCLARSQEWAQTTALPQVCSSCLFHHL